METMLQRVAELDRPVALLDEDVVRASLLEAIAVVEKAKADWFKITKTGQTALLNVEQHLNDELNALLRGTFLQLEAWRRKEGAARLQQMCL